MGFVARPSGLWAGGLCESTHVSEAQHGWGLLGIFCSVQSVYIAL